HVPNDPLERCRTRPAATEARGIAQTIRTGWCRAVQVEDPVCRSWRAPCRPRADWCSARCAIWRTASGRCCGRPGLRSTRAQGVRREGPRARRRRSLLSASAEAEPPLAIIATMAHELAQLTRRVLAIVRDEPVCRRLMGVPGVGPLTALAFRATIDRPDRFRRSRDVGAHLGLTPKRYQSGETDVQGGISRCG